MDPEAWSPLERLRQNGRMPWPKSLFRSRIVLWGPIVLTVGLLLGSCSGLGYYAHVAHGQGALLLQRRSIDAVLSDPATDPKLAARLRLAQQARQFASARLGLPDNRSYTRYVDLHRSYVVWNVFATPPYSIAPIPQCFPIAGCVAYRGYFEQAKACARAAQLQAQGDDVDVGGVPAYSTLGWFSDPILSSMLRWDDDELAGTIFHELAHQLIYVKDDTAFNESFASFVQEQGLREWRESRGLPPADQHDTQMDAGFTDLVLDLRERLKKLYAGPLYAQGTDKAAMAAGKQAEIESFRARYRAWRDSAWPGDHRYDAWVAAPINNARLLPFGLYDQWQPAFAQLFRQSRQQWPAFYAEVRKLAGESKTDRDAYLARLSGAAPSS